MGSKKLFKKISTIASALVIAASAAFVVTATTPGQSSAAATIGGKKDCTSNSIIYCGASTTSQLYSRYKASTSAQHVYSAYGISASAVASLGSTAVTGYTTKNGNVYLSNGTLVAKNAYSAGFHNQYYGGHEYSTKHTYAGTTYYNTPNSAVFLSGSISGWIVMKNNVFQYMILASCGNPLKGTPTTKPPVVPPAPKPEMCKVPGKTNLKASDKNCYKTVTVTKVVKVTVVPPCPVPGKSNIKADNKDCFVTKEINVCTVNGKTIEVNDSNVNICTKIVTKTVKETPMCQVEGKENLKADDKDCVKVVTQTKEVKVPVVTTKVVKEQPQQLVNTGPGDVLGIFAGTAIVATIGSRLYLRRRYNA